MHAYCPHCKQKYEIEPSMVGETAECQACGKDFIIKASPQSEIQVTPIATKSSRTTGARLKANLKIILAFTSAAFAILSVGCFLIWRSHTNEVHRKQQETARQEAVKQSAATTLKTIETPSKADKKFVWESEAERDARILRRGGEWGKQAGQFALGIATNGVKGYELANYRLQVMWNLYYRDAHRPSAELIRSYGRSLPDGYPEKETWEKLDAYNKRVEEEKAKAKTDWERLSTEGVIAVWETIRGGGFSVREDSNCLSYDAEGEIFTVMRLGLESQDGKYTPSPQKLKLNLQNTTPIRIPCEAAKAKRLLESQSQTGFRIRNLEINSIDEFESAEITAHLVEFAVLDAVNNVLLYWHEEQK